MLKFLTLVDASVWSEAVLTRLRELSTKSASFHLVVPARVLTDGELEYVETEMLVTESVDTPEQLMARWRLRDAMTAMENAGFESVTGTVGNAHPMTAIDDALDSDDYDSVIVVTGPLGPASWVSLDLPSRIKRHLDEPVTHIEVHTADQHR